MDENALKIRVEKEGDGLPQTIAQLKELQKALIGNRDLAEKDTKQFKDFSAQLVVVRDEINRLSRESFSANARMKESYFALGQELRSRTIPLMTSFSQIVQDAPYGIRGIGNNIEFLTQQFIQLKNAGMTTNEILADSFKVLSGPTGILFAVSAFTSLATVLGDKIVPYLKGTNEEIHNFNQETLRIGRNFSSYGNKMENETNNLPTYSDKRLANDKNYYLSQAQFISDRIKLEEDKIAKLKDSAGILERTGIREQAELKKREENLKNLNYQLSVQLDYLKAIQQEQDKRKKSADSGELQPAFTPYSSEEQRNMALFLFGDPTIAAGQGATPERPNNPNAYQDWLAQNTGGRMDVRQSAVNARNREYDTEEKQIERTRQSLQKTMQVYNSIFFDPIRASFDAVASGSQSMADAFIQAIKKMIVQLLEFAAASAILSAFGIGTFSSNFGVLSGSGSFSSGRTIGTQDLSNMGSQSIARSGIQTIIVEGKIANDYIYISNSRALAKRNATKL